MVEPARWQSVGPIHVDALAKARSEAINLVQWLARIANSFVTADTAEERIALGFRPTDAAFVTKTFARDLSLELRLPRLEMQFREGERAVPHIFDPEERSPAEVEAWLLKGSKPSAWRAIAPACIAPRPRRWSSPPAGW